MIVEIVVHRHCIRGSFDAGCTLDVEQLYAAHFAKFVFCLEVVRSLYNDLRGL